MEIQIEDMNEALLLELNKQEKAAIQLCNINPGISCTYNIDGERKIASISFWSNGLCDIESIEIKTEQRFYQHYEFETNEEAKAILLKEIKSAIAYA